jgi:hypothetical protein
LFAVAEPDSLTVMRARNSTISIKLGAENRE